MHIENDGQKESVNRSGIIMGGVNPIVLCHRARVREGECGGTHQHPRRRKVSLYR